MEINVSIITVNYNGLKDTCALIDSIPFNDDLEVIVIDNASQNDEASVIEKRYPKVKVIRSKENLGFARGKYLFFINNDTILSNQTSDIRHLINRLESSPKIGAVCPKIRFTWDNNPIQFAGYTPLSRITMRNNSIGYGEEDQDQYDSAHPTPYAHGAAMMVKREAIEKVGLMPECYFLYYEELDWSMMFQRAGYDIWYEPACTIYHKESQSTGQDSPLKAYYLTRNRLLFAKRNIQGIQKYITYFYLIGIVAVRDIMKHAIKGNPTLLRATYKGIRDFLVQPEGTPLQSEAT